MDEEKTQGPMEKEDGSLDLIRTEKSEMTSSVENETLFEENIDKSSFLENINKSGAEDNDYKPDIVTACEAFDDNTSEDFNSEPEELENDERDEGVGSLLDEMSASADLETTASLEGDMTQIVENDVDVAGNNGVRGYSTIENEASKEEHEDKSDDTQEEYGLLMDEEITTDFKDGSSGPKTDFSNPDANDSLPEFTAETSEDGVSLQYEAHKNDAKDGRDDSFFAEDNYDDIKPHLSSATNGELAENNDGLLQVSDSETLTPRDENIEMENSPVYKEAKENVLENYKEFEMSDSNGEKVLPDDNTDYLQEYGKELSQNGAANVLPDQETENSFPFTKDEADVPGTGETWTNDDAGEQESCISEEKNQFKSDDKQLPHSRGNTGGYQSQEDKPQMKNPPLHSKSQRNGEITPPSDDLLQNGPEDGESALPVKDDATRQLSGDWFYADDDMSSIFSDDGRDISSVVQENSILREAMIHLRNENPGGFTDTVSETSDDNDDLYPYGTLAPTNKFIADRDLDDARLNEVLREKREAQAKMRQLEREKASADRRYRQDKMERHFLEERFAFKASQLEEEIRCLKQENQRLKRGGPQVKGTAPASENNTHGAPKTPETDSLSENGEGSIPEKNGFAKDIAILAKENEKLSEIIDHLLESPRDDSLNDFVDTLDKYVPKEEYIRVENEKFKLETVLREKERHIKEQERVLEETRFDLEEENEILRENLRKAENKNKEKGKLLSQYEIKMMEVKTKFAEKVSKLESKLDQEISKKSKLESVIINLKKCNENFDKEIQGLKNRVKKLQNNELELEEKNRREKADVEGRLSKEADEKAKLGKNVEALLQDLMQMKNKMLEETEKHRNEKEQLRSHFENERAKMAEAQERDNRRIMFELEEEKKRNEQLKKRMAEIPGETIVAVMEKKTEAGLLESTFNGIEPGLVERTPEEVQFIDLEKNNVTAINELPARNEALTGYKPLEDNTGSINNLQKKLAEMTKFNSIVQRRNKEIEEENINLKEKMERVGRDVHKLKELEDRNEELQEEMGRNAKKRNELQKKQSEMMEEIEDISHKLSKVEGNNCDLSNEVERLTKKIKTMEQDFAEEKAKLVFSLENEKSSALNETEKRLNEDKAKMKKLEREIDDLNSDIKTLKDAKRAAEEKFVNDTRELVDRHSSEIANERERYRQLQDELNNNAGAVRRITEEWEQMLRNAVNRYEEDVQKNEEERRKMADDFQRQKEEMKSRFEREKGKLEVRVQEIERMRRSPFELEVIQETTAEFSENPQNYIQDDGNEDFNEDKSHISNILAEKHAKIRSLVAQKQKLEQKLEQMQKSFEDEKKDLCQEYKREKQKLEEVLADDYKRRLEESKRYYESLLDDQRKKYEKKEEELENKFRRERKELEEKLKQELSNDLSSRSAGLENKIQDLVSQKVQEQKEITKTIETQMRNRLKDIQNEKNENKRQFEREKKVLEATIQALTKELAKAKQEKKDFKKKQKKDKAELEEAFESEKREMKQMWEKGKVDTINRIEEEWSEKLKTEQIKTEIFKEELQENYKAKLKQMTIKFKAEKAELGRRLADAASETTSLDEAKREMQANLEDEYKRKSQRERENIESTLQGLRREIEKLQEHRKQLQSQMEQRESQAKANAPPLLETNSQVRF